MSLVSVIIPTYNRPSLLKEAIKSILNQRHKEFEIIVIDDFSNSDSRIELTDICSNNKRIQLHLNKENIGPGASRNIGLLKSKGNYILFMDDDDEVDPGFLQQAVSAFEVNDKIGAVILDSAHHKKSNRSLLEYYVFQEAFLRQKSDYVYTRDQLASFILHPPMINSFLFKRALFDENKFDSQLWYGEDVLLWVKLLLGGSTFHKLPSSENSSARIRTHEGEKLSSASHDLVVKCLEQLLELPVDRKSQSIIRFKLIIHLLLDGQWNRSVGELTRGIKHPILLLQAISYQLEIKAYATWRHMIFRLAKK